MNDMGDRGTGVRVEDRRLEGNVVLVTGGASGIGRAVALAAGAQGAVVVAVDLDSNGLEQLGGDLRSQSTPCATLALDVTNEHDMAAMAESANAQFGRIDALVACAGILRGRGCLPHPVADVTLSEWEQVLAVNLTGVFLSNRAVLSTMTDQRRGDIINVSSTSGRAGRANDAAYCASKFGVIGFSEALAQEVRSFGVRVQSILPDAVDTPIWRQNGPIRPEYALDPARVADVVLYMISLPRDTVISAPVIAPFRTRRRRSRADERSERVKGDR